MVPCNIILLPEDSEQRKAVPLFSGCLAYFPNALTAVARQSFDGNQKHNPGEPLHWAKEKSSDHADCIVRHLVEGDVVAVAWRALALLETAIEEGYVPDSFK